MLSADCMGLKSISHHVFEGGLDSAVARSKAGVRGARLQNAKV